MIDKVLGKLFRVHAHNTHHIATAFYTRKHLITAGPTTNKAGKESLVSIKTLNFLKFVGLDLQLHVHGLLPIFPENWFVEGW